MTNAFANPAEGLQLDSSFFDSTPGLRFVFVANPPNFTIAGVTNDMCRHLGLARESMVGRDLFDAFPAHSDDAGAADKQQIIDSLHLVIASRKQHRMEKLRYDTPVAGGGFQTHYWNIFTTPVINTADNVTHIIHTLEDISAEILAEKSTANQAVLDQTYGLLQESNDRYETLLDSIDQGFCIFQMIFDDNHKPVDYLFLEVNRQFEKHTGLKDAVGKRMRELVPNHDEHWFDIYGKVAMSGESIRFQQGSESLGRWFDLYAFPASGKDRDNVAVLFSDISQRKMAELELWEKDENLRNIVHTAPVAMFIFRTKEMILEMANALALQMMHRTEDVIGKPLLEVLPELRDQPNYRVFQVYETGEAQYGFEVLIPLERNGKLEDRYFNFAYTPLMEKGKVVGVMDVATDVTDQVMARKQIEEVVARRTKELAEANNALQISNTELQRSNAYLEEFAHAASHDLKEPIRKIHFFTERLRTALLDKLTPEDERMFGRVQDASQRMNALIDDLLLYSHVTQKPHEKEAINLNDKFRKVLDDLEVQIEEKEAVIKVHELPNVLGYRRQLQQLFQNLMTNALKYSRAGVRPEIEISASLVSGAEAGLPIDTRYHKITVTDNGIGFEQEQAEKIFQMFQRLHGKSEYQGTGVGLAIARKVVENHDGKIAAESIPGEGSSFHVFLPDA